MKIMFPKPSLWFSGLILLLVMGCGGDKPAQINRLSVGVVSYDQGARSLQQYEKFKDYLAERTEAVVDLEPTYNELNALDQIKRRAWTLVFAPPGLAALAIDRYQYIPLFPTQGVNDVRSVIVVAANSPIASLSDLNSTVIALGQPGSAAGYYLPLYDLYGLTLAEIRFAPTPKTVLEWIHSGQVAAGALSKDQYQRYRSQFPPDALRILHTSRSSPAGVVLLGPTIAQNQQEAVTTALRQSPSAIADDAGFIPTAPVPNYSEFIKLVNKVKPIEAHVRQKPAVLTLTP